MTSAYQWQQDAIGNLRSVLHRVPAENIAAVQVDALRWCLEQIDEQAFPAETERIRKKIEELEL